MRQTYRGVWLQATHMHRCAALLGDLGVLAMYTTLLVFLPARNLFLKPKCYAQTISQGNSIGISDSTRLFLARLSFSSSPVGASESAKVLSSSIICRRRMYARITAGSRTISVVHSPSTYLSKYNFHQLGSSPYIRQFNILIS